MGERYRNFESLEDVDLRSRLRTTDTWMPRTRTPVESAHGRRCANSTPDCSDGWRKNILRSEVFELANGDIDTQLGQKKPEHRKEWKALEPSLTSVSTGRTTNIDLIRHSSRRLRTQDNGHTSPNVLGPRRWEAGGQEMLRAGERYRDFESLNKVDLRSRV